MTQRNLFGALTAVRKRREQIVRYLDALDREEAELNIAERVLQKLETIADVHDDPFMKSPAGGGQQGLGAIGSAPTAHLAGRTGASGLHKAGE